MSWIFNLLKNFVDGSLGDFFHLCLEVRVLVVLDEVQHRNGSMMEVSLSIELAVGQEVSESSLLNKLILFVDSVILELFFSASQMLVLDHLDIVSPLVGKLLVLVVGVDVVEDGELWTNEEREMPSLNKTDVKTKEHLVMPDHSSEPIIVFPTAHS